MDWAGRPNLLRNSSSSAWARGVLILSQTYGLLVERIYESLAFLPLLPQYPFILQISVLLLVVGMAVGALGSAVSLRRFMKV